MPRYPKRAPQVEANPYLNGEAKTLWDHYYSKLAGVAMTRYRWKGLPDTIDSMRLEYELVLRGGLAAWTHVRNNEPLDSDGLLEAARGRFAVTKCVVAGPLDDLFNAAGYSTYGPKGVGGLTFTTTKPLEEWRGVPIWGDSLRMDYDGRTISLFATRLAQAALVVDTNMKATTRGVVVMTDQDQALSAQTFVDGVLSGVPQYASRTDLVDGVKAIDLGVHPDNVERSHVVAMRLWNEALTALGVQAGASEKEERLTDDEVEAIRGAVEAVRRRTLTPRRLAAEQINRRYYGGAKVIEVLDQW